MAKKGSIDFPPKPDKDDSPEAIKLAFERAEEARKAVTRAAAENAFGPVGTETDVPLEVLSKQGAVGGSPMPEAVSIPAIERIPFDPHSVLSVDESNLNASQYTANPEMQADMDALSVAGARNALETDVQEQINRNKKTRARGEFIAGAGEHVAEDVPMMDGTPKEWKQKLIELVGKFGEGAKEKTVGGAERMTTYLSGRLGELDTAIAAKTEKGFRSLGEWYGKLGWKSKLAVGLSLGIGMGVSAAAGASIPAALGLVFTGAGIGAQRIAGLSAMFLKYEKSAQDGKWGKEKAMGKAILYTAGMTGAMMLLVEGVKEAIDFANQPQKDEAILRWIGSMTGDKTLAPDAAPAGSGTPAPVESAVEASPAAAPAAGEVAGKISSAAAPEAVAPATIEMPTVKASAGHGYEYMMKRLWEDLHAKGIGLPANANPDSDLARLLAADEDSIDKLVHEIASDSKHQFFRPDGSSVLIIPDAQMTIGARGELFLSDAGRELQVAPAHVAVTPAAFTAPHVESPAPTPEALDLYFGTQSAAPQEVNPLTGLVNEQTPAPVETAVPHTASNVEAAGGIPVATDTVGRAETVTSGTATTGTVENVGVPFDPSTTRIYAQGDRFYVLGGDGKTSDAIAQAYAQEKGVSVFVDKTHKLFGLIPTQRFVEYTPDGQMVIHNGPALAPDLNALTTPKDVSVFNANEAARAAAAQKLADESAKVAEAQSKKIDDVIDAAIRVEAQRKQEAAEAAIRAAARIRK